MKHEYHIEILVSKWTELETKYLSAQGNNDKILMKFFWYIIGLIDKK